MPTPRNTPHNGLFLPCRYQVFVPHARQRKPRLPPLAHQRNAYRHLQNGQEAQGRKTMERAATAKGKFNRVDIEDEQTLPLDQILVISASSASSLSPTSTGKSWI